MLRKTSLLLSLVVIAFGLAHFRQATAAEQTVFLRLTSAQYATITALHWPLRTTIDYTTFHWVELAAQDWISLAPTARVAQTITPANFELQFAAERFDPLQRPQPTPLIHSDKPDLHLIQLIGPTKQEWLDQLQAAGIEPLQYIYPYTYVVWSSDELLNRAAARSAAWPFVRWHGRFEPAYRLQTTDLYLPETDALQPFNALIYHQADNEALEQEIEQLGGTLIWSEMVGPQWRSAQLTLTAAQLPRAAALAGVYTIQAAEITGGSRTEFSALLNIGQYDASFQPQPGYLKWLSQAHVNGQGVVVATVDEGVLDTHPDLVKRMAPCTGQSCAGTAHSLHGTHTAGIIAGDGSSGATDSGGFLRGLGVAPRAKLIEQTYRREDNSLYDLQFLMLESNRNGAVISSNSWGPQSVPQGYNIDALKVDIGVRDANATLPGNQPLTYVVAMMNGFGGTSTQGSPDEAKNIITVGSTKARRLTGDPYENANDLSLNSGHGPALDGRHIPQLVAPGYYIDSTDNTGSYRYLFGTSMAAPQVSGAAALFIDYYRQLFGVDPSPAMIKAALFPVAYDLAGNQDADGELLGHRFDNKQGWGRLNVGAALKPSQSVAYYDNVYVLNKTGDSWQEEFIPANPTKPVLIMLVWTDAPGHGLGGSTPAWNNDLDLVVETNSQLYRGNGFGNNGRSVPNGTADERNNSEGVFFLTPPQQPLSFTVTVTASNLPSDGIPNEGDNTDQDFALACYNCVAFQATDWVFMPMLSHRSEK